MKWCLVNKPCFAISSTVTIYFLDICGLTPALLNGGGVSWDIWELPCKQLRPWRGHRPWLENHGKTAIEASTHHADKTLERKEEETQKHSTENMPFQLQCKKVLIKAISDQYTWPTHEENWCIPYTTPSPHRTIFWIYICISFLAISALDHVTFKLFFLPSLNI